MSRPISAAYLERKLRAILGVQGSNPLPELADVNGLLVLESDRPEWMLPGGELQGWERETQAAVAAQFSWTALVNPVGSGALAVLEAVFNSGTGTGGLIMNYDIAASPLPGVGGSSSGRPRDGRAIGTVLACQTQFGASAAALGDGPGWSVPTLQAYSGRLHGYIELGPGQALVLRPFIVNELAAAAWHWRERPLEGRFEVR